MLDGICAEKDCSEACPKNIKGSAGIGLVDIIDDGERESAVGVELGHA
jgi:hypothetical protein